MTKITKSDNNQNIHQKTRIFKITIWLILLLILATSGWLLYLNKIKIKFQQRHIQNYMQANKIISPPSQETISVEESSIKRQDNESSKLTDRSQKFTISTKQKTPFKTVTLDPYFIKEGGNMLIEVETNKSIPIKDLVAEIFNDEGVDIIKLLKIKDLQNNNYDTYLARWNSHSISENKAYKIIFLAQSTEKEFNLEMFFETQ